MPGNPLANKMKLKPGLRAAILYAPDGYIGEISPLPEGVEISDTLEGKFDWVQIFVKDKAELESHFPQVVQFLKPASLLWISFPKGTSKIQTDLSRDRGWDVLRQADLKFITLISVNETWSAFALRPYKGSEKRQPLPWDMVK